MNEKKERERERERERETKKERERESVCVCVCVCVSNHNLQKHDENVVHGQQKASELKRESQTQLRVLHSIVQENTKAVPTNKQNSSSTSCLKSIISNKKIQKRK
jgi:hypothetical protein